MAKNYYIYGRHADSTNSVMIQPHGAIIVIKEPELTILQVSANTKDHFGLAPEELVNRPLAELLGEAGVSRLRDQYLSKYLEAAPHYLPAAPIGKKGKIFEIILHRSQSLLILECERKPDNSIVQRTLYPAVNSAIRQMRHTGSARELCQAAADEIRRISGFDRVMIYKFSEDNSSDVIAESLGGKFESYRGLRCPAFKTPQQAQGLDRKNWLRIEVDMQGQPIPLVPQVIPGACAPPDLRLAVTRSLSPNHIKSLSYLGVTASMFISIVKDDRMWGLIACHHHTGPKYAPHNARMACECVANFLSLRMASEEDAKWKITPFLSRRAG